VSKKALTLLFIIITLNSFSRSIVVPTGGKPAGMGNAFVSQSDAFSVYHNPAGLARFNQLSVALFYENKYFVENMSVKSIVATMPTQSAGTFSLQFNSFGAPQWAESNIGASYALSLSKTLAAGVQLHYYGRRIPEANILVINAGFDVGAIYQISDKTSVGANISNLFTPEIRNSSYTEYIPWRIRGGGHTNFAPDFTLSYEVDKIETLSPSLKIGGEWEAYDGIFFRAGFNTAPSRVFAGFGYLGNHIQFDIAFSYHHYLGYVPSSSIIISI
jgi:hypothetical protein